MWAVGLRLLRTMFSTTFTLEFGFNLWPESIIANFCPCTIRVELFLPIPSCVHSAVHQSSWYFPGPGLCSCLLPVSSECLRNKKSSLNWSSTDKSLMKRFIDEAVQVKILEISAGKFQYRWAEVVCPYIMPPIIQKVAQNFKKTDSSSELTDFVAMLCEERCQRLLRNLIRRSFCHLLCFCSLPRISFPGRTTYS